MSWHRSGHAAPPLRTVHARPDSGVAHGRRIRQEETFRGDVPHSWKRESGHRVAARKAHATESHHGLATTSGHSRQAGFRLPTRPFGRLRGRMFLAWVSQALPDAGCEQGVLARKTRVKRGARPERYTPFETQGLAGGSHMGMPACQESSRLHQPNQESAGCSVLANRSAYWPKETSLWDSRNMTGLRNG